MAKLRLLILLCGFLLGAMPVVGQQQYQLQLRGADSDSVFLSSLGIPAGFPTRNECVKFITELPASLRVRGYVTASLDSVRYDSSFARVVLFLGSKYEWGALDVSAVDPLVLQSLGWRQSGFDGKVYD